MKNEIEEIKIKKATQLYWLDVESYGSENHTLRALDCQSRTEAINMLAKIQNVKIFKFEGKIIIQ